MSRLSLVLLSLLISFNAVGEDTPEVNKFTDVLSCAQQDGSLTHRISQKDSGDFTAYISLPVYQGVPTQKDLEESKKLWKEWDGNSPTPPDPRRIRAAIPLDSGNLFSFDIGRLQEKVDFFDSLFKPVGDSSHIPIGFGSFAINFSEEDCQVTELDGLMSVHCQNFEPIDMNGIEILERVLSMSYEKRSEVILDHDTNKAKVIVSPRVMAALILKTKKGQRIKNFKSEYTYNPDGNEKQCHVRGISVNAKAKLAKPDRPF